MRPLVEILTYYERFAEESRFLSGPFLLEFERTKELPTSIAPKICDRSSKKPDFDDVRVFGVEGLDG
jgi:hypothetical protein